MSTMIVGGNDICVVLFSKCDNFLGHFGFDSSGPFFHGALKLSQQSLTDF